MHRVVSYHIKLQDFIKIEAEDRDINHHGRTHTVEPDVGASVINVKSASGEKTMDELKPELISKHEDIQVGNLVFNKSLLLIIILARCLEGVLCKVDCQPEET